MFNITETQAFNLGFAATLTIVVMQVVGRLTRDISPSNQRAKRLAIATNSAAVLIIGTLIGCVSAFLDIRLAGFLVFPSIALTLYILLVQTGNLYRFYGGQPDISETSSKLSKMPISIEAQTREQQAGLWEKLKALPHFQHTFEGDLFSLITGDRVFWSEYAGETCLAIELSGRFTITVCRFETLWRYVLIQERIAMHLPPQTDFAIAAPAP